MTFDPQRNVARCYLDGTHRSGNSESRRVGLSSPANRDWGSVFAARLGGARPARVRLGAVRQGDAWNLARSGLASQGEARRGRARQGEARIKSRLAPARLGWVRQGVARSGTARHGKEQVLARRGLACLGQAGQGLAWRGVRRFIRTHLQFGITQ